MKRGVHRGEETKGTVVAGPKAEEADFVRRIGMYGFISVIFTGLKISVDVSALEIEFI